jgi:ribosomal protein S27E
MKKAEAAKKAEERKLLVVASCVRCGEDTAAYSGEEAKAKCQVCASAEFLFGDGEVIGDGEVTK